jgi:ankyrin repeat protein
MKLDSTIPPLSFQPNVVNCPYGYVETWGVNRGLRAAICEGHHEAVSYIIDNFKVDYTEIGSRGNNAVHDAIESDLSIELVERLITRAHDSGNAIHEVGRYGQTPLMRAVERGRFTLASVLVRMGASICVGPANASDPRRAAALEQANKNAQIFLDSEGNIAKAHAIALRRRVHSFESVVEIQHTALRAACSSGDLHTARALIQEGADPSFVLMRTIDAQDKLVSPTRVKTVKNLIAAGADVTVALIQCLAQSPAHSMRLGEGRSEGAVKTLLWLGASSRQVLEALRETDDALRAPTLLKKWRENATTLRHAAIDGNKEEVRFWCTLGAINPESVLSPLVKDRNLEAVKLLFAAKIEHDGTLSSYLSARDTEGLRFLFAAGADTTRFLAKLNHSKAHGLGLKLEELETLIAAGLDVSKALLESANQKKDRSVARFLVAAGANIEDAVARAPENARMGVRQILNFAAREVAQIKLTLTEKFASTSLIGDILIAQAVNTESSRQIAADRLNDSMRKFGAQAQHIEQNLSLAVEAVDWTSIQPMVATHQEAAANVLVSLLTKKDVASARLIVHAGVDSRAVIQATKSEKERRDILSRLIQAGQDFRSVVEPLIDSERSDFLKRLIKDSGVSMSRIFRSLVDNGEETLLKKYVALSAQAGIEELITACKEGNMHLANTLISAGVSPTSAFSHAVNSDDPAAAETLMELGADKSMSLASSLALRQTSTAELLLLLGANLSVALANVEPRARHVEQLIGA